MNRIALAAGLLLPLAACNSEDRKFTLNDRPLNERLAGAWAISGIAWCGQTSIPINELRVEVGASTITAYDGDSTCSSVSVTNVAFDGPTTLHLSDGGTTCTPEGCDLTSGWDNGVFQCDSTPPAGGTASAQVDFIHDSWVRVSMSEDCDGDGIASDLYTIELKRP